MRDFVLIFIGVFIGGITWDLLKWALSGRAPWDKHR